MHKKHEQMYLPHPLPAIQLLEARRLFELQQIHNFLDKQKCLHMLDPLGPLRQLAMSDRSSTHSTKPFTSFGIRDILSGDERDAACGRRGSDKQSSDQDSPGPRCPSTSSSSSVSGYSSDRHCDISWSPSKHIADRNSTCLHHRIIRPWCPSTVSTDDGRPDGHRCLGRDRTDTHNNHVREDILRNKTTREITLKRSADHLKAGDEEEIDVEGCEDEEVPTGHLGHDVSPLGALVAMSTNAFKGLESFESPNSDEQHNCRSQVPKKKRKTRTAFTNQQIYELEKRFIMQKYLTPADRDEIASKLGLTCAQVITWFQNRRAKFKRDIDEMKKDVGAVSPPPSGQSHERSANGCQ